jgi:hypothetical protein
MMRSSVIQHLRLGAADPGQLGAGALPLIGHKIDTATDTRRAQPLPEADETAPWQSDRRNGGRWGLSGSIGRPDQPHTLYDEKWTDKAGVLDPEPTIPSGLSAHTGAPDTTDLEIHEHDALPPNFERHHIPAMGIDAASRDRYLPSDSAVGGANQVVLVDYRRVPDGTATVQAGFGLAPPDLIPPQVWDTHSDQVVIEHHAPPVEVRAGRPTDDGSPGHLRLRYPRWIYQRPFDQWQERRLNGNKPELAVHVGTPVRTYEEAPGKMPAPGMTADGPRPNTWRVEPSPWDQELISTDPPTPAGMTVALLSAGSEANRGWRAR